MTLEINCEKLRENSNDNLVRLLNSSSTPAEISLLIIKEIKNRIIGSNREKKNFLTLNISKSLLSILENEQNEEELQTQTIDCISSLLNSSNFVTSSNLNSISEDKIIMKYFEENEFISEEIIQIFFEGNKLFELLCFFTFKENEKLLYSSLRALKALFKFPSLSHINFSSVPKFLENIAKLIKHKNYKIAENALQLISNISSAQSFFPISSTLLLFPSPNSNSDCTPPYLSENTIDLLAQKKNFLQLNSIQNQFKNDVLFQIISIIFHPNSQKISVAAALEALSQLTFENDQIIKEIFLHWKLEKFILILLKFLSHPYSKIKFYSAVCLTNLWRRKILIDFIHQIKINLIPTLISLFNDSNSFFSSEAPFILARLIEKEEELQRTAADAEGIKKATFLLKFCADFSAKHNLISLSSSDPFSSSFYNNNNNNNNNNNINNGNNSPNISSLNSNLSAIYNHLNNNNNNSINNLLNNNSSNNNLNLINNNLINNNNNINLNENNNNNENNNSNNYNNYNIISNHNTNSINRLFETSLLAIAAISSLYVEGRTKIIGQQIMPIIVICLSHYVAEVRSAACRALLSLSRSVRNIRTAILDGNLAAPLFKLLNDQSTEVQICASAALCNVVVDFSPMKKDIVRNGGVQLLVKLSKSENLLIRLNAVWALKNLSYLGEEELKISILKELTIDQILLYLSDKEQTDFQIQMLLLLRNISFKHSNLLFQEIGFHRMTEILYQKLNDENIEIVYQSLLILCNISADLSHKSFVMNPFFLKSIKSLLQSKEAKIRTVAVWCLINLTWTMDEGWEERREIMIKEGFLLLLQSMKNDEDNVTRERVQSCIVQLQTHSDEDHNYQEMDINLIDDLEVD